MLTGPAEPDPLPGRIPPWRGLQLLLGGGEVTLITDRPSVLYALDHF